MIRLKKIVPYFKEKPLLVFLILLTIIVFGQSLFFDFLNFDDKLFILDNAVIANLDLPWTACLKYKFQFPDYFPLSFLTWRGLNFLFGFNPFVFHFVNILVHALNVALVYIVSKEVMVLFFKKTSQVKYYSLFLALAFSIHPLHVESVAWVIDLKDLFSTCFYLLAMVFYIHWLKNKKLLFYFLALGTALISMLYKSTGITFFAMLFLIDYLFQQRISWKWVMQKIPFGLIVILGLYIFGFLTNTNNIITGFNSSNPQSLMPYFPNSLSGSAQWVKIIVIMSFRVFFWIKQTLFPWSQTVFYSRNQLLDQYECILLYIPAFIFAMVMLAYIFRKRLPAVWFGLLFFIITLSPSLVQSDIGVSIFTPDRYMYLPVLGLFFALIGLLHFLPTKIRSLLIILLLVFWGVKTITYLPVWKNSESLYNNALSIDPNCPEAILNRSAMFYEKGEFEKGITELDRFIILYPTEFLGYMNRGKMLHQAKAHELALTDFSKALELKPRNFDALLNRGLTYFSMDSLENARRDFSNAYDKDSTHFTLNKSIALLYQQTNNYEIALGFANKCLLEQALDIKVLSLKGIALFYLNRYDEALAEFNKILEIDPTLGNIWYHRSMAFFMLNKFENAQHNLGKAQELNAVTEQKYLTMLADSLKTL